jgi:hypothetical protein
MCALNQCDLGLGSEGVKGAYAHITAFLLDPASPVNLPPKAAA